MSDLPLLSILPDSASDDRQRFIVAYKTGENLLKTVARIPPMFTPEEHESIRWYLEESRSYPFEPSTTIARNTEVRLQQLGWQLFDQIFNATAEGRDLWSLVEEQIDNTRIEVAGGPARFTVPWELLWNPLDVMPVACRAASFVRTSIAPAPPTVVNAADSIRVLLVISRPAGTLDVPLRSVAARLLDRVDGDPRFHIDVLRPPTFVAFASTVRAAADLGAPFTIIHFDGHGVYEDRSAQRENRPARRRRGYLLFEDPSDPNRADYIDAPTLGELLAEGRAPILILNACRSAHTEIWTEQMGSRRPLGSLADELLSIGQPAVLAMQYNVEVETASYFIADLYQGLATCGSLAKAMQVGRRKLFIRSHDAPGDRHLTLHDWLVPVLFETAPHSLFHAPLSLPQEQQHCRQKGNTIVGADDGLMAIERAFRTTSVVVLTGPVGSGKSTLAAEFAAWDARTRDKSSQGYSPLSLLDAQATDYVELLAGGSRVLVETRDPNFSLTTEHAVVRMTPLELSERITLMRQRLPNTVTFDPELWQAVFAFSQGNPSVLLNIADMVANGHGTDANAILETARSQPIGLATLDITSTLATLAPNDVACVTIAALFEGPVSSRMLRTLASTGSETCPVSSDADVIFDRLSALGLATPLGNSYYQMHPGLPGLLRPEFEHRYPGALGERIQSGIVTLFSSLCAVLYQHAKSGERYAYERQVQTLSLIEPTIWRVLDQAIAAERWPDSRNLAASLRRLLTQHGRRPEWQQLAARLHSLASNQGTGTPHVGRESVWYLVQEDLIENLMRIHSNTEAAWLQEALLREVRKAQVHLEGPEADQFAEEVMIPELRRMGDIRTQQRHLEAAHPYLEALQIAQRINSAVQEQRIAAQLAAFYLSQEPVNWSEVEYWLTYSSELSERCTPHDRIGRAQLKVLRGEAALMRSQAAEAVQELRDALQLLPSNPSDERAKCQLQLGQAMFEHLKSPSESMQHVQSAIAWYMRDENVFQASCARLVASHILSKSGENGRAFFYAQEAARGFASLVPHAESKAREADQLATTLANRALSEGEGHE